MDSRIRSQHILEVRYKPVGSFLNIRGSIADRVAEHTPLREWSIGQDRVDFHDGLEQTKETGFVSYRNFGYLSLLPPTRQYFPDRALKFIKEILSSGGLSVDPILRIGVRSTFIFPYSDTMEQLVKVLIDRTGYPKQKMEQVFGGTIIDIGMPTNFESGNGRFNIQLGPMKKEQIEATVRWHDDYPDVGLYLDIDFFKLNPGSMSYDTLSKVIRAFADDSWDKADMVLTLIR